MMIVRLIIFLLILVTITDSMTSNEKTQLRLQVVEMFKHAFGSYMVLSRSLARSIEIDFLV